MPRLFVPPTVARELLEDRRRFAADITRACFKDRICLEWDRELQRLDPLLEMVRAPDKHVVGTSLLPGLYHVVRKNEGAPPSVIPVQSPDGGFIEPPGRLLEQLKGMDLWDTRVSAMRERIVRAEKQRLEREKERNRAERQERIVDHFKAVSTASVSLNRDTPWRQNTSGRLPSKKA